MHVNEDLLEAPSCGKEMESVAHEILDALRGVIGAIFRSPGETADASKALSGRDDTVSPFRFGALQLHLVSAADIALATVIVAAEAIWAHSNRATARAATPAERIAPEDALGESIVSLAVTLGRCELSAAQLA
ncbi:hypothetical protein NO135_20170, partial [Clostridioides difficile]|nr:hypothetical protein [Clostridioides difficile]